MLLHIDIGFLMAVFLWFRDWLPESLHIKVFCLDRFRYGVLFFPTSSIDTA